MGIGELPSLHSVPLATGLAGTYPRIGAQTELGSKTATLQWPTVHAAFPRERLQTTCHPACQFTVGGRGRRDEQAPDTFGFTPRLRRLIVRLDNACLPKGLPDSVHPSNGWEYALSGHSWTGCALDPCGRRTAAPAADCHGLPRCERSGHRCRGSVGPTAFPHQMWTNGYRLSTARCDSNQGS